MKPTKRLGLLFGPSLALILFLAPDFTSAQGAGPFQFTPITPCRVVDTRLGQQPLSSPKGQIKNSQTVKFPIRNRCSVPASAAAVAVNMTTANVPTAAVNGWVALVPADQVCIQPNPANQISNINFTPPGFLANGAVVPLATTGTADVAACAQFKVPPGGTDIILDVTGYFVPTTGLRFYSISPCRVIDTETGLGGFTGFLPNGGSGNISTVFTVKGAAPCDIPDDAVAIAANATAANTQDKGYLALFPGNGSWPGVSNVNFFANDTIGNGALVPLSAGVQDLAVLAQAASSSTTGVAYFQLDVTGYFK